ncbi:MULTISPECIES: sodium:solute symporter family protein [unclassified Agarivorans]|uniref:sodium:solute symporter family protein n=1 Tax=unclassified Agarivorans TaxID=2636026 RepID=UPI0026E11916|nr:MULTISPECIES: sodium:solute symporter family protein [unclassified Agarivorans]MDO6686333.1 sodium:solute symporter family protein [Agarivorans sp. 3_MG-2023]MDO6713635.1 sodium:solute symporter family protein [Agarivorans sp. 2_MG-2023]
MDIQTWTSIFIASSFTLYMIIAVWAKAKTTHDFYLANAQIHPLTNGLASAANWMSAASFISLAGLISFLGYDAAVYLMGWTGGYVLLALCLAPYLKRFGQVTVADFIGERYYSQSARLLAVICTVFISFIYVAGQMRGVGVVFARFLDVNVNLGVMLGMAIVFVYAVWGGMKGITYTQVAQYCVLIFAFLVPAIFTSFALTGQVFPQIGLGASLSGSSEVYLLDRLDGLSQQLGFNSFTNGARSLADRFFITAALMMGTAGLPHIIIRFQTVAKVKDTRLSVAYALVFIAILYTAAPAVAAFAKVNIIESINGANMQGVAEEQSPAWLRNWQQAGLVEWSDNNGDGRLFYSGDQRNEIGINPDIIVLASPELAQLPNWVVALVAAGGLAAALSTAAGLLLVISSSISHDILKQTLNKNLSDQQELKWARISAVLAIIAAGYFGANPPALVAEVVAIAFGLAASSLFPGIILGIFVRKMSRQAAIAGMLSGMLFTLGYIVYFKYLNPPANNADGWLWGISPEGIGALGMVINFSSAFVIQYFVKPAPKAIQQLVISLRKP